MKLHLLEELISQFIASQLNAETTAWYYPHSMVNHFHLSWKTPDQASIKEMYDQCLRSDYSQRWWKRDGYRPKEIMITLMDADAELATIAWKDLANDAASLDGRLYRFNYYCDELLQLHRQINLRSVETFHHQDASIVSLYLSGMFPAKYSLYPGLDNFQSFCKAVGSPDIPVIDDLVRYMKVVTIVFTFLQRNPGFVKIESLRHSSLHPVGFIPFQMSYELIAFAGQKDKPSLR